MSDTVFLVRFKDGDLHLAASFNAFSLIQHDEAMRGIAFLQRVPAPAVEALPERPQ